MARNNINIVREETKVVISTDDKKLKVTGAPVTNTLIIQKQDTDVVRVKATGPKGDKGEKGDIGETPDVSFLLSSSIFNEFTSSYYNDSGSFSSRVSDLELFSSSLDSTFATDAELTAVSSSINSTVLNLSSSLENRVSTNEIDVVNLQTDSGSFSNRVTDLESFSSSLDSIYATDEQLENVSSSLSSRITTNETDISNIQTDSGSFSSRVTDLESFSSSLDSTFATDEQLENVSSSFESTVSNLSSSFHSFTETYNTGSFSGSYVGNGSQLEFPSGLHVDGDITNYNRQLPDIGAVQTSDKRGYGTDYISNKVLSNSKFGRSGLEEDGGFRIETQSDGAVRSQMYLNGAWRTVLTGVTILTDSTESPKDIEFTDFTPYRLSLITGDSDFKDINGVPMVQQMTISMGAIQKPQRLNGGTF